ncbi:MAG: hypothetical protein HXY49_11945 [Ignavibacteriaceae bacterium]|nr:hypothetical protein [Ignavibacteriaceae bacterium]
MTAQESSKFAVDNREFYLEVFQPESVKTYLLKVTKKENVARMKAVLGMAYFIALVVSLGILFL